MKMSPLPKDPDALLAFAESIATALSEKQSLQGIASEIEAPLRAAIATATFAIDRYVAVLAHSQKSPEGRSYIAEAKRQRDRAIEQLRGRVIRSIRHLCRLDQEAGALEIDPERPIFKNSSSETKDFRRRKWSKTGFPDRSLVDCNGKIGTSEFLEQGLKT